VSDKHGSKYGTDFQETELALAAQEADWADVDLILSQMFPGERIRFANAMDELASRIKLRCEKCGEPCGSGDAKRREWRWTPDGVGLRQHRYCDDDYSVR
jgi:hypothetical protein